MNECTIYVWLILYERVHVRLYVCINVSMQVCMYVCEYHIRTRRICIFSMYKCIYIWPSVKTCKYTLLRASAYVYTGFQKSLGSYCDWKLSTWCSGNPIDSIHGLHRVSPKNGLETCKFHFLGPVFFFVLTRSAMTPCKYKCIPMSDVWRKCFIYFDLLTVKNGTIFINAAFRKEVHIKYGLLWWYITKRLLNVVFCSFISSPKYAISIFPCFQWGSKSRCENRNKLFAEGLEAKCICERGSAFVKEELHLLTRNCIC